MTIAKVKYAELEFVGANRHVRRSHGGSLHFIVDSFYVLLTGWSSFVGILFIDHVNPRVVISLPTEMKDLQLKFMPTQTCPAFDTTVVMMVWRRVSFTGCHVFLRISTSKSFARGCELGVD